MKICEFCDSECADTVSVCPSCGGDSFRAASNAEAGQDTQEVTDGAVYSRSGCSLLLLIFLWVAIFPIPLTKVVLRQRDWQKWLKAAVIVFAWAAYILICFTAKKEVDAKRKSDAAAREVTSSSVADPSVKSESKTPIEEDTSQTEESDPPAQDSTTAGEKTPQNTDTDSKKGNIPSEQTDAPSDGGSDTDHEVQQGGEDSGSWTEEDTDF